MWMDWFALFAFVHIDDCMNFNYNLQNAHIYSTPMISQAIQFLNEMSLKWCCIRPVALSYRERHLSVLSQGKKTSQKGNVLGWN